MFNFFIQNTHQKFSIMTEFKATEDARLLHDGRDSMYRESDKYRSSFINCKTGLLDKKYLCNRVCPTCGASENRELFVKNGGTYVACNSCDMVFLNPVFTDKALTLYYQNNNSCQAQAHISESDFYCRIYNAGLNQICRFIKTGNLLDIGCSGGFFLDIASDNYRTHGIELNFSEAAIARSKGHHIWEQSVDSLNFEDKDKFDVITLWDVFEHIKDGNCFLLNLKDKLRTGGVIFLQVPNVGSLAARVMKDKCNMFDGLEHVNLYNPKTISALAENAGYNVLYIESIIDELKPVLNYLRYEDPYKGSFGELIDFDFLTPNLISSRLLGYKLQVILAKKNNAQLL